MLLFIQRSLSLLLILFSGVSIASDNIPMDEVRLETRLMRIEKSAQIAAGKIAYRDSVELQSARPIKRQATVAANGGDVTGYIGCGNFYQPFFAYLLTTDDIYDAVDVVKAGITLFSTCKKLYDNQENHQYLYNMMKEVNYTCGYRKFHFKFQLPRRLLTTDIHKKLSNLNYLNERKNDAIKSEYYKERSIAFEEASEEDRLKALKSKKFLKTLPQDYEIILLDDFHPKVKGFILSKLITNQKKTSSLSRKDRNLIDWNRSQFHQIIPYVSDEALIKISRLTSLDEKVKLIVKNKYQRYIKELNTYNSLVEILALLTHNKLSFEARCKVYDLILYHMVTISDVSYKYKMLNIMTFKNTDDVCKNEILRDYIKKLFFCVDYVPDSSILE